jgi:DNA-binding FadR family transcriptional regulator
VAPGPLHVLLAARLGRLIDEAELPPGEPLPRLSREIRLVERS